MSSFHIHKWPFFCLFFSLAFLTESIPKWPSSWTGSTGSSTKKGATHCACSSQNARLPRPIPPRRTYSHSQSQFVKYKHVPCNSTNENETLHCLYSSSQSEFGKPQMFIVSQPTSVFDLWTQTKCVRLTKKIRGFFAIKKLFDLKVVFKCMETIMSEYKLSFWQLKNGPFYFQKFQRVNFQYKGKKRIR